MTGWHEGMMCSFDVETTGTDVEADRIVTASVTYVDGAGRIPPEARDWLVDPGIDIPEEATRVHGITTGHAREHGMQPRQAVIEIVFELLRTAGTLTPVIAYNMPFDFTVMDRETRRLGLEPFGPAADGARGVYVDPYVIDKAIDPYRKGKRTLTAVAEHYGVKAGEAHTASGDAITAARLAWKIASVRPEIGAMSPTELHAFQVKAKDEQARSFRAYLTRMGREEQVDGSWPVRPWTEEAAA